MGGYKLLLLDAPAISTTQKQLAECLVLSKNTVIQFFIPCLDIKSNVSGAHQMEPPSPTQALGVNPFPSRSINRTVPWGGFAR